MTPENYQAFQTAVVRQWITGQLHQAASIALIEADIEPTQDLIVLLADAARAEIEPHVETDGVYVGRATLVGPKPPGMFGNLGLHQYMRMVLHRCREQRPDLFATIYDGSRGDG